MNNVVAGNKSWAKLFLPTLIKSWSVIALVFIWIKQIRYELLITEI